MGVRTESFPRRIAAIGLVMFASISVFMPTAVAADPPSNDSFQSADVITALPFADRVDISSATTELFETAGPCTSSKTVWYEFEATETTKLIIDTRGTAFTADIAVFDATLPVPARGSCTSYDHYVFSATAGTSYRIRLGTKAVPLGPLVFSIHKVASVSGKVIDESGTGVSNIEVWLDDLEDPYVNWNEFTATDVDGSFRFDEVRSGRYRIGFYDYSWNYLESWYPSALDESGAQVIEIVDEEVTLSDQVILIGGKIKGSINISDGNHLGGCILAISQEGIVESGAWVDDGQQQFEITSLKGGAYRLKISDTCYSEIPYGSFEDEWFEDASSPEAATALSVARGTTLSDINITVTASAVPINDHRSDALTLDEFPVSFGAGLTRATTSSDDPLQCGIVGRTTWYEFTPIEDELIKLSSDVDRAGLALFKTHSDGSLTFMGCAGYPYSPQNYQVTEGDNYLLLAGATRTYGRAGLRTYINDTDGGGKLHFAPGTPCTVRCPYWQQDKTVEQKHEDACAPTPQSPEGSWEDQMIEVPDLINGKVPYALGFMMDPAIDHDVWLCREEPDENGKYLVTYAANSPTAKCDLGLPIGCSEMLEASVQAGKRYIVRVYNWSDTSAVEGTYWFRAAKAEEPLSS